MKTLKLVTVGLLLAISCALQAQISIHVTIGAPPPWGPAASVGVRFYYLPDIEAYYDVSTSMFIYLSNGRWIYAAHLPPRYGNYNLYTGYKVVLTRYHGERPYEDFREDRREYPRGYGRGREQKAYGERHERGNNGNGYHPGHEHENEHEYHGHGEGHGHGHGHGDHDD